jgi:plastocyanin
MRRFLLPATVLCGLLGAVASWSQEAPAIKIDNFKFGPDKLTVTKGTEVTWTNRDDIPHSIVMMALGVHSKPLDTDNSFAFQFDKAGTYNYICGIHPAMHGQIVVK